jgi:hypothetical protein
MSKKPRKTNKSQKNVQIQILNALLASPQSSMYKLNNSIQDSTFSTVRRNLYKLEEDGLIKIGEPEERNAMEIQLTPKGIAKLLIESDLQKEDLLLVGKKILQKDFNKLLPKTFSQIEPFFTDIFCDSLLEIRPKINLKFFDEKWFIEVYIDSTISSIKKAIKKYEALFEKEGIWATKAERERDSKEMFEGLSKLKEFSVNEKDE